ncbi:hypothetical protein LOTGIDRAFT_171935 [Lottia gigantea]|uniref:Uncharacterized protein n=1 Tax=Lottia gigantea TaxID=225164 RepID=V4B4X2_LOTGI|nr:hypothetical protein LOTGIDRAFT_171935 [Lottia gigantea]ESP02536.1 hypothetical protein LOTGIDRAFT_171935 [Lottia gigantea]
MAPPEDTEKSPTRSKYVSLENGDIQDNDSETVIEGQHYYTLPTLRFINIVKIIIFIDGILSIVLWLTGGHTKYFVDNIVHFHLTESVFDLALICSIKSVLYMILYTWLEELTLKFTNCPFDQDLKTKTRYAHFGIVFIAIAVLTYTTTKGGLVLNAYLNKKDYRIMHPTYNALVISAFVFSFIQIICALYSFVAMRKLKVLRILHRLNDDGEEVDADGKPIKKKANILRLIKLAKPEAGIISLAFFAMLGSSGVQIVAPLFFGKVVDAAQRNMDELNNTVLILLFIYMGGALCSSARSWIFTLAGQRVVARLRKDLFKSVIKQEVAFFDTNRTGEICNRLSSDTQVLQNAVTVNMSMLFRYLLQIIGSLVLMFVLNPSLTGVLIAVVPIVSLGAVQYGRYLKKVRKEFQDRLADAGTTAEESISSIRTVRSFSGETKAIKAYGSDVDKSYKEGSKLAAAQGLFDGTIGLLSYGAVLLVLWYGGKLVYENTQDSNTGISPGVLTSFLLYTLQVALAFALLSSLYGDFMQALGASLRIFELFDRKPLVSSENGDILPMFDGHVEFKNVHFTYPSRPETPVIKGINLTVSPGQVVALVGPSGGGKSTIVSLIERFYDPDSGSISLGGQDLTSLDPQWFRQKIAMVSQEPTLFACSIKENIAYGRNATDAEIVEAAKQANAHEFIQTFESGYDTLVGERGVRLSGGQKQRIAISRALIMDPVILLLDEATSALDAESEHLVQEAIDRAMKGRTVIVIAHRLSTVRNANKVIVIDKGLIAEQGSHDELLAVNGVYKRLVLRQLTAGGMMVNNGNDNSTEENNDSEQNTNKDHDQDTIQQLD